MFICDLSIFLTNSALEFIKAKYGMPLSKYAVLKKFIGMPL